MNVGPLTIRWRLTLWYTAIFAAVLVTYIFAASLLQFWELNNQLYHAEVQDMETVEGLLYFMPNGTVGIHEHYDRMYE